jgi:C1A family cysteine protease
MKTIAQQGVCDEALWWYNPAKFTVKANKACYANALKHKALAYLRVNQSLADITACIAAGFPVVFGISVYDSFESDVVAKTGVVPMPGANESNLGGHAICMVGYDNNKRLFKFRNSWGSSWGDKGYGYLPYAYVLNGNLADDFWTIRKVSA